jgi:hypothetical protein
MQAVVPTAVAGPVNGSAAVPVGIAATASTQREKRVSRDRIQSVGLSALGEKNIRALDAAMNDDFCGRHIQRAGHLNPRVQRLLSDLGKSGPESFPIRGRRADRPEFRRRLPELNPHFG